MKNNQSGSIIFLLFLVVGLVTVLTVTVLKKNQNLDIDNEQAAMTAAEIMQILNRTDIGLQRFLMTKDLSIEDIDLYISGKVVNGSTNSCATDSCNLYHVDGGGVSVPVLPHTASSKEDISLCSASYFSAEGNLQPYHGIASIEGVGSDLPEVLLYYCGVSLAVCEQINIKNGVRDADDDATVTAALGASADNDYKGFDSTNTNPMAVTTANYVSSFDSRVVGKRTFCYEREKAPAFGLGNLLFHIVYPR